MCLLASLNQEEYYPKNVIQIILFINPLACIKRTIFSKSAMNFMFDNLSVIPTFISNR